MPRAMVFLGAGQRLEPRRFDPPEPRSAELLVRVTCCTLCRSDLHTYSGRRIEPTPIVLGHEIVGRIEAFGPDAPRRDALDAPLSEGDRVSWCIAAGCGTCYFCAADLPQKCERLYKYGHERLEPSAPPLGGLSDFVLLVPGTRLYRVPDALADPVAASANCSTATVAAVLRRAGAIADRRVVVLGAGVLGLTACAMARAGGASAVIVCDPVAECRERAVRFGATRTCDAEELSECVREATQGRGADCVLELSGAASSAQATLSLCRTGGTIVLAGTVAPVGNLALDPEQFVRRLLTLSGVHNYHPRDLADALAFLAGPGAQFPWRDLVVEQYPLEQAEAAFAAALARPGVRIAVAPELDA